ncbi:MAG: NAD(P)/FAD-dependent oxidoreductase [Chloroflexi bacterium]|nr:MAG: NAD(P)/FAD-dependent oxidoreductase [Chloroflexota bacterium]
MGARNGHQHAVIIGAGPAGLTASYELMKHGIPSTVIEKDPTYVGGLARTVEHKGYRFDIGGHRFFSKNQEVEDLWTEILGPEMLTRGRLSRIYYRGRYFAYPIKAANALWNLGPIEAVRCMASYAKARITPVKDPRSFEDWTRNQFGWRLYNIFFKTYTEKVWGISTKELSADWAAQRIKSLGDKGQPVLMGRTVDRIMHDHGRVTSVITKTVSGEVEEHRGSDFVSSMPIRELVSRLDPPPPDTVRKAADSLGYRDFISVAVMIDRADVFPDNWIYVHDPTVKVGRIQNFKNWSPDMVPDQSKTCLGLEYFCFEGDGLWTSSDDALIERARNELAQLGICQPAEVFDGVVVRQRKAYPVYDDRYETHVGVVRDYIRAHLTNLHLAGRNGMHKYNNQDHSMMTALLVARNIANGGGLDPWKVNADAVYHEEVRVGEKDLSGRQVPERVAGSAR